MNNITRKPVFGVSDQSQNILEIFDILVEEWYYLCKNKTKAEIRCTGIAQLTREFVFTYMQKNRVSHKVANVITCILHVFFIL